VAMVSNSSFGVTTYSDGGAVANHGTFKAIDSLFQHNDASNASTNNNSATGGAIQNRAGGTLTVSNSTFSDNSVTTFFVGQSAGGGAVYVDQSAQASFANVTFEANLANGPAQQGGNIANSTQGTINFSNTIIADGYSPVVGTRNCSLFTPYVTSSGGNLETSNAQCITATTTDHVLASPALGPLTNNGGPTNTHRPGAGSDAFGFGDVGACAVETTDQRGGTRVIGGKCDSGAVQANSLADLSLTGALSAPGYGSPVTYSLIVTNNGPDAVLGATIAGANCTIGFLAAGASTPCMGSFSWNGDSAISQTFTVSGAYVDPAVGGNSITLTALAPRLTTVSLRPTTFAAARKGATIAAAAGAKIKFTGIDLAGLEATVQRPIKGNVKNGVCVKRKKGVKAKGRGCNLWSTVGTGKKTLTAQSGTVKFSGRVKKKALKAGTYRVMLVPVASNGAKGSPWPLTFKIKG
jgi:hypothetical protein